MARIAAIDPGAATGKSKELLDQVQRSLGRTPNMMRAMAGSPAVLQGYLAFSGALSGGKLGPRLREQIALAVGQANACQYCVSAHTAIGTLVGLGEAEIGAARAASASDPKVDAALAFARDLVESRGDLTDQQFDRVRRAGYADDEIAEIIGNVVLNIYTNYFNKAVRTEVDFPPVELGLEQSARAR